MPSDLSDDVAEGIMIAEPTANEAEKVTTSNLSDGVMEGIVIAKPSADEAEKVTTSGLHEAPEDLQATTQKREWTIEDIGSTLRALKNALHEMLQWKYSEDAEDYFKPLCAVNDLVRVLTTLMALIPEVLTWDKTEAKLYPVPPIVGSSWGFSGKWDSEMTGPHGILEWMRNIETARQLVIQKVQARLQAWLRSAEEYIGVIMSTVQTDWKLQTPGDNRIVPITLLLLQHVLDVADENLGYLMLVRGDASLTWTRSMTDEMREHTLRVLHTRHHRSLRAFVFDQHSSLHAVFFDE